MTQTWLLAFAAVGARPWMFPVALAVVLAIQVGAFLAVEKLSKALARRRKEKQHA